MIQSEAQLEESLIKRLVTLGYEPVSIGSISELEANLKKQLEAHNKLHFSPAEFQRILNHLDKGSVFERAKLLRDYMQLERDDGSRVHIQFLDSENWCQNRYQVTQQVSVEGRRKNRYDVTLLINGLPLAQIELKRRGMELKEAFHQINRYQRDSYAAGHGLFQYIQLFVISNGVNTKYYANNRKQDFKQTFFWADKENTLITRLDAFADSFLEKCQLSRMICKYIVLHESDKLLMVLRPYQYYAAEAILERVHYSRKNGYIWHTTGSGKTLTSFKAAQLLTALDGVDKVVFVVDRADLDYQTTREFNHFSEGSVDGTSNTQALVKQMAGQTRLIVTTIQKLNTAIKRPRHEAAMTALQDKRIVFIFDECHRSQFGETHRAIVRFFRNAQLFGFTGTPIFKDNAMGSGAAKRTTKDLFDDCLHRYVITNAIADQNVLRFSVEYWGKLKRKDGTLIDEDVPGINISEFFEHEERLENVVDWIIQHHNRKTHNREFSSIFCVSSVEVLLKYYDIFKRKQQAGEHDLRMISIFSYGANEEDPEADGLIADPNLDVDSGPISESKRERLEGVIRDYNALYGVQHSAKDGTAFYTYYKDIAKRMKERDKEGFADKDRADILLVVNMFLTGFDAKKLNTLYVDKNLKYHGLIQAYSRTNRILGERKSQGNIVVFRNLKPQTDEAVRLFSDSSSQESILLESYEHYVERFNQALGTLRTAAPGADSVSELKTEAEQLAFVTAFRSLIRELNVLKSFSEFDFSDLALPEQDFEDYKSAYLDIYERRKLDPDKTSILEDINFELELIQQDEINVDYILGLLEALNKETDKPLDYALKKQKILDTMQQEVSLRSKRALIEKFMNDYMPSIRPQDDFRAIFDAYWTQERTAALERFAQDEGMQFGRLSRLLADYQFSAKKPLREDVFEALERKPKVLERTRVYQRILTRLDDFMRVFDDGG